jgi:GntR family transcriptional regulator
LTPQRLSRANGPLYKQLIDALSAPIRSGEIAVGDELPRESDIAERFSVSLITVRQALRKLEQDGLILKRSAKPALVVSQGPNVRLSWSFQNFADMAFFADGAVLEVKSYGKETSPVFVEHFGMRDSAKGYRLSSILCGAEDRRTQVTTYFPPHVGSQFSRSDFKDTLIFRTVQERLRLRFAVAKMTVRAELAAGSVAEDLQLQPGSAVMCIEMLFKSDAGQNVEYSIARHSAESFNITYEAPNDLT